MTSKCGVTSYPSSDLPLSSSVSSVARCLRTRGALVGMFKMVARLSDVKLFCSNTSRAPCTPLPVKFSEYSCVSNHIQHENIIYIWCNIKYDYCTQVKTTQKCVRCVRNACSDLFVTCLMVTHMHYLYFLGKIALVFSIGKINVRMY